MRVIVFSFLHTDAKLAIYLFLFDNEPIYTIFLFVIYIEESESGNILLKW